MQAVILCGGLGTRMHPDTLDTPKCLLDIAGKPFLHRQLDMLERAGFPDIILLTGHMSDQIIESVVSRASDQDIVFMKDTGTGTGQALYNVRDWLDPKFLLTYGDVMYSDYTHYSNLFFKSLALDTNPNICAVQPANLYGHGNLYFKYRTCIEYPVYDFATHLDSGVYVLESDLIKDSPQPTSHICDLLEYWSIHDLIQGYSGERVFDIGSHSGLKTMRDFYSKITSK